MINRTKIKDSIYDVLDKDPKEIQEYIDTEAKKDPKQIEKEKKARNETSNITDVNLQENINNQEDNPYNKIVIHTEKDNLVHNYFHYFDMYWDAGDVMSSAILKLPKTDVENTKYWITYTGYVTIYLGNEINVEQHKNKGEKTEYNYFDLQGLYPIFKGEIGRIKEYNKELEIHIDSIGKRFKQKIPEEFRQSFIYNQNVRDAFQAICEFLGVKYICPPAKKNLQDNETEESNPSGDGTENNVDDKMNQESQMAAKVDKSTTNDLSGVGYSTNGNTDNGSNDENNQNNLSNNQNNLSQNNLNESGQEEEVQKGYLDISFDANGAIVHGSSSIITSPDMEDTLLELEEHPLDKYLKDTTYVATDVKKFLDGEMFDELHPNVLNYGSVTVEPKSAPTSNMSNMSPTNPITTPNNEEQNRGGTDVQESNSSTSGNSGVKGVWGKTAAGGYYLTADAINKMSMAEAKRRYEYGKEHEPFYTRATMEKLWYRWMFGTKFY